MVDKTKVANAAKNVLTGTKFNLYGKPLSDSEAQTLAQAIAAAIEEYDKQKQ